ncbi:hypothetical protein ABR32_13010 [Enterobacter cloacae subsp. dissolvens]|nr:hypothetical protein ABR32_13010 [Enterobacter cloacae subsp. dissolvens]
MRLSLTAVHRGRPGTLWHARGCNQALNRLHGDKRTAAINVGTLVITLFGIFTQIATGSRMCRVLTFRTMKHTASV